MSTPSSDSPVPDPDSDAPPQRTLRVAVGPGVSLHVREAGDGPPLLLLHGFPDHGDLWQPLVPALAAGHRLWLPDLRGYRHSDKPATTADYDIAVLLADVRALADALTGSPTGRLRLAGHDWGGMLAWAFAALHPERVERLVVFNAPHPCRFAELLRTDAAQREASAYVHWLRAPGADAVLAANGHARLRAMLQRSLPRVTADELEAHAQAWSVPGALPAMLQWYRALDPDDPHAVPGLAGAGGRIDVPTLLLWGDRDGAFVPANLDGLDRWVPELRIARFADAGHWLLRERPAEVGRVAFAFLTGAPA